MIIYLINSAESEFDKKNIITGSQDVALSEKGKKQAENLGEFFKDKNISMIFTSELKRSKDTAKIILKYLKKKPKVSKIQNFNERKYGLFEAKRWDVISAFYKEHLHKSEGKLFKVILEAKGGESWQDLILRVVEGINDITEEIDKRKAVLIIGHLDVNRVILRYTGNMNEDEMFNIWQTPACINIIKYEKEEFNIQIVNYILSKNR
ncbi:MAG: histidine phosphatase family protein [Candidatus Micrarchaeia archaeon]|jgi:broad specificity phosphatase PhoE